MPRPRKPQWPALPRRPRGTGSIQRLPDGTLRARLPSRVSPTRQSREFGPDQVSEAAAWLDSRLTGADAAHNGQTPLGDWCGYWWETVIRPGAPHTTANTYLIAVRDLAPIYHVALADLRPSHFQGIIASKVGHLSPISIRSKVSIWRTCLEAAVDDELTARNPVRKLSLPKVVKTEKKRRGWTEKEARALWSRIRDHRFEAIYTVILGCGLRIGEVLGLHWRDVDIPGRRTWIGPQWTSGQWRDAPKGNNPHWIHLPGYVVASLIRHRDRQGAGSDLVFPSPVKAGQPWSYGTVRRDLVAVATELGINEKKLHAGRHALGSYLIEEGISPPAVADILGHADPSVTLGIYAHATERGVDRARRAMDAFMPTPDPDGVFEAESGDKGDDKGDDDR